MGSILINIPDIADSDLVFDEDETRRILKFFWTQRSTDIDNLAITNDVRRFAQTALMASIEGSYAMGYIQALGKTVVRPGSGIKSFGKKLAKKFFKHWWKHTKQTVLEDLKIYDSIRNTVANHLRTSFELMLNGMAVNRHFAPFYAWTVLSDRLAWA